MDLKGKKCKIVCDGKEMGSIEHTKDGVLIRCSEECKKACKDKDCC